MKNITTGICHNRIQTGKPPYFCSWQDENGMHYVFFSMVSSAYDCKRRLMEDASWAEVYSKRYEK